MDGLNLQYEKWEVVRKVGSGTKNGKKANELCIVDQNHNRSLVVLKSTILDEKEPSVQSKDRTKAVHS